MSDYIHCFACGAKSLDLDGECHPYMLSSPGCWAMYCEVLEKEYSDLKYWSGHQFTVDAYACQHVGKKEDQRAVNSVNIHLAALYAIFKEGMSLSEAPNLRSRFSQYYKGKNLLVWLEPPESFGDLTIFELWNNEDPGFHYSLGEKWAKSVWESWSHQHQRISFLVHNIIS